MPHVPTEPFAHTLGPRDAKIALVGEAWGEQEELAGIPFIGNAGQELSRLLGEAGIDRRECFITNTINARPLNNDLNQFCGAKRDVASPDYTLFPLRQGKYLLPEYIPELSRLREELTAVQPNLVIALGGTALWALRKTAAIGSNRGTVAESTLIPGQKILATYHPSYLFKVWSHRPIVLADLMKAKREAEFPEIRRPERTVLVDPTLDEMWEWASRPIHALACDIETGAGQIKCIGFARHPGDAIVVPFLDYTRPGNSYWLTLEAEVEAWNWVEHMLRMDVPKIFQNGLYDLQYILRAGLRPRRCEADTMLLHHALYPELQKSLGFLGSIYTNESSWKLMRGKSDSEETKRDE